MKKIALLVCVLLISAACLYPVSANNTKKSPKDGIVLDGYFDDWADKPSVKIKYNWDASEQYSLVKWYTDDTNLYLYIKMAEVGYSTLSTNIIDYHVDGGNKSQFQVSPDDPTKGRISVYDYSLDNRPLSDDGYVVRGGTISGINGDQAEFRIPLSVFVKKNGRAASVKLEFPDLGDQFIEIRTGSTYPYVGIALCIIVSALGVFIYKRKSKTI